MNVEPRSANHCYAAEKKISSSKDLRLKFGVKPLEMKLETTKESVSKIAFLIANSQANLMSCNRASISAFRTLYEPKLHTNLLINLSFESQTIPPRADFPD